MRQRRIRHVLMALSAMVAGLAIVATQSGSASAANVSQTVDCGIGGSQTMNLTTTAPATVAQGGTFHVKIAPSSGGTASGAEIKNMVTSFQLPSGASYVAGSAVLSGGSGTLGATSVTVSGTVVQVKVPGPVANGASFTNPTLDLDLKATGTAGQTLKVTFKQSGAYSLTAAGSINVSCNANTPLTTLTSTVIEAAATTTTQATTTTTGTGATTTTSAGPTTTLPPVITTQSWSPGTACGVPEITTAPANATSVTVTAAGGHGGKGGSQASSSKYSGGNGGQAVGTFAVSGGQTLSAVVGCNGADGQNGTATSTTAAGWSYGGGAGAGFIVLAQTGAGGGGGGGSSAACLGPDCTFGSGTPLVVAGGGGGAGVSNCAGTPAGGGGNGGAASNASGDGGFGPSGANGGNGGNSGSSSGSIKGGNGGVNVNQADGTGGTSPSAGALDGFGVSVVGGGGGGGYDGGDAGQGANTGCKGGGGGGGGSSWVKGTATNTAFSTSGAPSVVLTFTISTPATTTTTTTQATTTTTTQATTTTTTPTCTKDIVPFSSTTQLIATQYDAFTGTAPTSTQLSQWQTGIDGCTTTADALIVSLLPTDQMGDDARQVRLYLAFFKRPPDPDGFAYWQRQLDAGKGLINAARKFADSPEFKRTYGSLTNSQFIDLVYQNVLDRAPDPTGKAWWLTRLDNHTKNRGEVMINFSESSENQRKRANAVAVFRMHRTMMGKFPSKATFFDLLDPITAGTATLEDAAHTLRHSSGYASLHP